jgi:hypothetical protein
VTERSKRKSLLVSRKHVSSMCQTKIMNLFSIMAMLEILMEFLILSKYSMLLQVTLMKAHNIKTGQVHVLLT